MADELGYMRYPGIRSKTEDSLFFVISAACDRLRISKDAIDRCVGIALVQASGDWAAAVKNDRILEDKQDSIADEQK